MQTAPRGSDTDGRTLPSGASAEVGEDVLRRIVADPTGTALVTDFDGVLAPIVADPATSTPLPGTVDTLGRLAGSLGVVAVLSGRPAAFLASRVDVPGGVLIGGYGAERVHDGVVETDPRVRAHRAHVRDAVEELRVAFGPTDADPGVTVEDKGTAVAVHWRRAQDRDAAGARVEAVTADVAARAGLAREAGKMVWELRAPVEIDKGTAVRALIDEYAIRTLVYAGDDLGDLPAFAAATDTGGAPLVVTGPDTAPEVAAVDGTHFAGPPQFAEWLTRLADALTGSVGTEDSPR